MAYTKTNWQNGATPPISADNLNHMEQGIYDANDYIVLTGTVTGVPGYGTKTTRIKTYSELQSQYGIDSAYDLVLVGVVTGNSPTGTANFGQTLSHPVSGVSQFDSVDPSVYITPQATGAYDGLFITVYNSANYTSNMYYKLVFKKIV